MKFRLSLRAAHFIDCDRRRREVHDFFRRAYDVRSTIVHGSSPVSKDFIALDGSTTTLGGFSLVMEQLMRRALHKAVELGQRPDWEGLLFGPP
jgi:hypothetical protein